MKTEFKLFTGLGIFMAPLGVVYLLTSFEPAGSILILLVAVAFAFIGVYLGIESRKMQGYRPEDYDAEQADGAGEVGSFPGASLWPFVGAIAVTTIAFGLVFSTFIAIPGLGLLLATIIGMARESEISEYHHESIDAHNHETADPPTFSDQVKK
jgi:archaellum biogenesis protein FlaJ (TadC family)